QRHRVPASLLDPAFFSPPRVERYPRAMAPIPPDRGDRAKTRGSTNREGQRIREGGLNRKGQLEAGGGGGGRGRGPRPARDSPRMRRLLAPRTRRAGTRPHSPARPAPPPAVPAVSPFPGPPPAVRQTCQGNAS